MHDLVCKHCQRKIRRINYAMGPEWRHVGNGGSFNDNWLYCKRTAADPDLSAPSNPFLPARPEDGLHLYGTGAAGYRCSACGAYRGSPESELPCEGKYKESSKMRSWAQDKWKAELEGN